MDAFLFPGQGAQRPGMGVAWQDHSSWRVVDELTSVTGRDIGRLLSVADAEELKVTANAQLATFTLCLVILDAVGTKPGAVAGHSLGEYSALVAAGVVSPVEGARLVAARGEAMAAAASAHPGTMAAILGLDPDGVAKACADVEEVWVANDNAPGQVVIAGTADGVSQAGEVAKSLGAKRVVPLAVGGAFHSPLMASAQTDLDAALSAADFGDASLDCVANVDAEAHRAAGDWRRLLSAQLTSQVRWRESVLRLDRLGVTRYVELGPGGELSGMVKRIVDGSVRITVSTPDDVAALG